MNLLMALIHYVQSLTYPNSDKLLPPEERSLGTIYRLLASTSVAEMDARFRALPPGIRRFPLTAFSVRRLTIFGEIS